MLAASPSSFIPSTQPPQGRCAFAITFNVSAVSAPLDRLYFEAGWACEKVSRTIWRFAWQVMDLLGATKLSSRAAETDVGRML
ncbi:hypothetical protein CN110_10470 [Sinorhizobium meliloti]|nr:hypothetical protein C3L21_27205 [Sinorhizobium meliloti]RVK56176.1 hypothetical protein CN162_14585 [Sinorhizobium meliloti]RVM89866.1 hypothetical protein CN122_18255 [Sinorhizobium meliloti]RVN74298.1 hypothetical protein CN110_10470 [Sinorhizobium meliloti]